MYSSTLSLTLALDVVGSQSHAPPALPPGKTQYPLYRRLGGHQGRRGMMKKISPPTGIQSLDPLGHSESLCRLSHPGLSFQVYVPVYTSTHLQSCFHILKLAEWGNGERLRKRKTLGMRLVPVLWRDVSMKKKRPVSNISASGTLWAGSVPLVHGTNAFTQTVVAESYSLASRVTTPSCLHSLNTFRVSSYQNWTTALLSHELRQLTPFSSSGGLTESKCEAMNIINPTNHGPSFCGLNTFAQYDVCLTECSLAWRSQILTNQHVSVGMP
jgi:hypothetical protein